MDIRISPNIGNGDYELAESFELHVGTIDVNRNDGR